MTEYEHDHESPREERANAISHGIGAVAALVGGSVLVTLAAAYGNGWQLASAIVFGITLVLLYLTTPGMATALEVVVFEGVGMLEAVLLGGGNG